MSVRLTSNQGGGRVAHEKGVDAPAWGVGQLLAVWEAQHQSIPSVSNAPFVRIVHYLLLLIYERVFSIRIDSLNALYQRSLPMTIVNLSRSRKQRPYIAIMPKPKMITNVPISKHVAP
jgi:hypothetical protein